MSMVKAIYGIMITAGKCLGEKHRSPSGGAVFRAYLKLKLIRFVMPWRRGKPGRVRILGLCVAYFNLDTLIFLFEEIFVWRTYGFETRTRAPRIIDAGANIGLATLFFKLAYPEARITCFEPDPVTFALLERNIVRNGLRDVQAYRVALGEKKGKLVLRRSKRHPGAPDMGFLKGDADDAIEVETETPSAFVEGPVDYFKLDVEGAEHGCVRDLERSGKLASIRHIGMEYHLAPGAEPLHGLVRALEACGFTLRVGSHYRPAHGFAKPSDFMIYAERYEDR